VGSGLAEAARDGPVVEMAVREGVCVPAYRLKDWRRIHTRYDRCAHTFTSAIAIAATILFWL
jgi:transposase